MTLSIIALALLAFTVSPVFAEHSCGDKKAEKAGSSIEASANSLCTPADMETCAKAMNISVEECAEMCGPDGKMTMHKISIKGMTCSGSENSVSTAIEGVKGVQKVVSISHKDELAVVCVDKKNISLTSLTKAITDKGYKAVIIPAGATVSKNAEYDCSKTCTSKERAACASKKVEKETKGKK